MKGYQVQSKDGDVFEFYNNKRTLTLDAHETIEDAEKHIARNEAADKEEGLYTKSFYVADKICLDFDPSFHENRTLRFNSFANLDLNKARK